MINENEFWNIIDQINWSVEDDEQRMHPVLEMLKAKSDSEIIQFQEVLAHKLFCLDTKEHAKYIGEFSYKNEDTHFSNDLFLYVRCCVVANGRKYYEHVLRNPREMPKDMDFEPLIFVGEEAYVDKTGNEWSHDTKYNYETYSNDEGWN